MEESDNFIYVLYSNNKTVFKFIDIAMLLRETNFNALKMKLNYYVKTGRLLNPRKGIYCKKNYNKEELACSVFLPAYVSLDYVLQKAGVIFQFDRKISIVSYLSREIDVDFQIYTFRKIKNEILASPQGIIQTQQAYAIASVERAFLDSLYLNGEIYFDNLRPINRYKVEELLPIYHSKTLFKRVKKIFENEH
jgi:hypothetical protein